MEVSKLRKREIVKSQRDNTWLQARKQYLTASDAGAILGINPFKSNQDVIKSKKNTNIENIIDNEATRHGTRMEESARDIFKELCQIEWLKDIEDFGLIIHKKIKWLAASPDGVLIDGENKARGLIEIKCPYNRPISNEPNKNYIAQIQHQLEVCDLPIAYLFEARFDTDTDELLEYRITEIERDYDLFNYEYLPIYQKTYDIIRRKTHMRLRSEKEKETNQESKIKVNNIIGFLQNDPLIDWLHIYGEENNYKKDKKYEFPSMISTYATKMYKKWSDVLNLQLEDRKNWFIRAGTLANKTRTIIPDEINENSTIPIFCWFKNNIDTIGDTNIMALRKNTIIKITELAWRVKTISWGAVLMRNYKVLWIDLDAAREKWSEIWDYSKTWYKQLLKNGMNWNPLNCEFLIPNMKNESLCWNNAKMIIAKKRGEASIIWRVPAPEQGSKRRKLTDVELNSEELLVKSKYQENVDSIITANQKQIVPSFDIDKIQKGITAFIDLEFIPDLRLNKSGLFIYLIGLYWYNPKLNKFETIQWFCNELTKEEEKRIVEEFCIWNDQVNPTNLIHWSHAEKTQIESALKRYPEIKRPKNELPFWDLMQAFIDAKVAIPGCYTYKLKDITKCLYSNGYLSEDLKYSDLDCENAVNSVVLAYKHYKLWCKNVNYIKNDPRESILKYNDLDCRVMYHIAKWAKCY